MHMHMGPVPQGHTWLLGLLRIPRPRVAPHSSLCCTSPTRGWEHVHMATCGHTSRSHIDHAWPLPTHGLLQVRSCAFLLSAHGYCSKATFFRLFIKEKPGLIGAPNRPEWYQRNFGRSMDGEDGSAEDEAETDEDMDEGSASTEEGEGEQQEQQACPCLPCEHGGASRGPCCPYQPLAHAWSLCSSAATRVPGQQP